MTAWLNKWWALLLLAVGCVALLSTSGPNSSAPRRFEFGPPLPAGRVKPQLISAKREARTWHERAESAEANALSFHFRTNGLCSSLRP